MTKKISIGTDFYALAEALKSIGHSERVAILNVLCKQKRMTVKSIYEELGLEQSIVSRHLGIMKRANILKKKLRAEKLSILSLWKMRYANM